MTLSLYLVEDPRLDWRISRSNVLVAANNAKEAKRLGYKWIEDYDYTKIQVRKVLNEIMGYIEPKVLTLSDKQDVGVYREMGHQIEGDSWCAACGLATMDGAFPLCDECEFCAECGHDDNCEEGER